MSGSLVIISVTQLIAMPFYFNSSLDYTYGINLYQGYLQVSFLPVTFTMLPSFFFFLAGLFSPLSWHKSTWSL